MSWVRRIFIILIWPFADSFLNIFANIFLLQFGREVAILATVIVKTIINITFFNLLNKEKELQEKITRKATDLLKLKIKVQKWEHGKILAALFIFTISGPAMVGVPFVWLLGISKKSAYLLIFFGSAINSIFWVGGVYNTFWIVVKEIIK